MFCWRYDREVNLRWSYWDMLSLETWIFCIFNRNKSLTPPQSPWTKYCFSDKADNCWLVFLSEKKKSQGIQSHVRIYFWQLEYYTSNTSFSKWSLVMLSFALKPCIIVTHDAWIFFIHLLIVTLHNCWNPPTEDCVCTKLILYAEGLHWILFG